MATTHHTTSTLNTATTLGSWAVAIARALEECGVDPAPLFERAGIDLDNAWDPNVRFEVVRTSRLFKLAAEACDDPGFGLVVGKLMRPTSWHALGFALWASRDLREMLERVVRYFKVYTNCAYGGLEEAPDRLRFWVRAYPAYVPILTDYQYEAFLATVVLTCRHLLPEGFQPLRVGLRRPPPADLDGFQRMFKCPVEFGQEQVWMELDRETASAQLPTANPELAQINDRLCAEYIARFDRADLMGQVYYRLLSELPEGEPEMERMAESLNVSTRTLQRKLKARGTSYKQLVDDVRRELALQYIQQSHLSIGEISYRLGFCHVGNFSRAFKRWTGKTPVECREAGEG